MEFLVHIEISVHEHLPESEVAALYAAEGVRSAELRGAGLLMRVWRDPGKKANWSLYEVDGPDELHAALTSLPLWRWMSIQVFPLALHPAEMDER